MESEFIALDKCGEEAEWLRHFLEDIPSVGIMSYKAVYYLDIINNNCWIIYYLFVINKFHVMNFYFINVPLIYM